MILNLNQCMASELFCGTPLPAISFSPIWRVSVISWSLVIYIRAWKCLSICVSKTKQKLEWEYTLFTQTISRFEVMFGGLPFRTKRSKALKNSCISIFLPNYSHHMAKHIAESVIAIRVIRGMIRVKGRGEGTKGVEEEEEEKGDLFTRCCA